MATTISDLPEDLLGQLLGKLPLTSLSEVRSTCKYWNALSKSHSFGKAEAAESKKQSLGFMVINYRIFSMKLDLQGIRNNDGDELVDPSIKQINILKQIKIYTVFYCDGLLLCVTKDHWRHLVWNPYLGQTRWIRPRKKFHKSDIYAFGYDDKNNNRNHKILRFLDDFYVQGDRKEHLSGFEIYDFRSNSWRVMDVSHDWYIPFNTNNVSLKGNTYFLAQEKIKEGELFREVVEPFLICFDFTTERFGPRLPLPFHSYSYVSDTMSLSCVRDEKLAVLYQRQYGILQIWITTTNVEAPNAVPWSTFLKVDMNLLNGMPETFEARNFFIDKEKKIVVAFDVCKDKLKETCPYEIGYIIGEDGYVKSVEFGEAPNIGKPDKSDCYFIPFMCSSYVPSLVQLQSKQRPKRKQRDY